MNSIIAQLDDVHLIYHEPRGETEAVGGKFIRSQGGVCFDSRAFRLRQNEPSVHFCGHIAAKLRQGGGSRRTARSACKQHGLHASARSSF